MRTETSRALPSAGVGQDERLLPEQGRAGKIVNFRWDAGGWWANDRGWEPLLVRPTAYNYPPEYLAPIRFLAVWSRHQGAEVYYLYERDGTLQYDFGNDVGATEDGSVVLAEDRNVPGPADPGTMLIPYGRFALLLNGYDDPIKFFGQEWVTPFGFAAAPPAPVVAGVDPDIKDSVYDAAGNTGVADDTTAIGKFPPEDGQPPFLGHAALTTSSYGIRYTWVTDTGAESPMSPEVVVSWTPTEIAQITTYAVYIAHLPRGPANVVARRVYQTKNMGDQTEVEDRSYYFAAEVPDNARTSYVLTLADTRLTIAAPDPQASAPLPPGLRVGVAFDGRLWLAGGAQCATRVIYSDAGRPEQFGAFSYFDLGNSLAGAVTQLTAHEGRLYIFRERGIDVIEVTDNLDYRVSSLTSTVGTTAANTIQPVPGFGLVFLSRDGIYALDKLTLRRISDPLGQEMRRIGAGSIARATATWSTREGEYWVQYPADGSAENARGAVLHALVSTPDRPAWSLRHITPTDGANVYRSVVTALATDPEGWIIFGTSPINTATGEYPGTATLATMSVGNTIEGFGLQVWSAKPAAGVVYTASVITAVGDGAGVVTTKADADRLESVWQSPWIEFDTLTRVFSVELWLLNTGRPVITFEVATDGREEWTEVEHTAEAQSYKTHRTSNADHVYQPDAFALKRGYAGVWGTAKWREDRVVRVKYDVHLTDGAAGSFAFRLRTRDPIGVLRYRAGANPTTIGTASQQSPSGGA